jgi:hypothetical protein
MHHARSGVSECPDVLSRVRPGIRVYGRTGLKSVKNQLEFRASLQQKTGQHDPDRRAEVDERFRLPYDEDSSEALINLANTHCYGCSSRLFCARSQSSGC